MTARFGGFAPMLRDLLVLPTPFHAGTHRYGSSARWPSAYRAEKTIERFNAESWLDEQLSWPPFLNLPAENDVNLRPGH
jgi:hypothetical protein